MVANLSRIPIFSPLNSPIKGHHMVNFGADAYPFAQGVVPLQALCHTGGLKSGRLIRRPSRSHQRRVQRTQSRRLPMWRCGWD